MYKLYNDENGNPNGVLRLSDNTWIPTSVDNGDYRAYLEWVAEGNEPLPADEPAPSV
jgi:hypothetical protein